MHCCHCLVDSTTCKNRAVPQISSEVEFFVQWIQAFPLRLKMSYCELHFKIYIKVYAKFSFYTLLFSISQNLTGHQGRMLYETSCFKNSWWNCSSSACAVSNTFLFYLILRPDRKESGLKCSSALAKCSRKRI